MDYEELKKYLLKELNKYKEHADYIKMKKRLASELYRAKISYENGVDLVEDLIQNKKRIKNGIIPFLLGLIDKIVLDKPIELKRVKEGNSGGIDIDTDVPTSKREVIIDYIKNKHGKECVIPVGTYAEIGLKSGLKDILRKCKIDFKTSAQFCDCFDSEISWEQNLENLKHNTEMYELYLKYKSDIDMTPFILNKIRSVGCHAGGICILPKSVYNYIPVMRVASNDSIVTAFVENGANTDLDECGIIKIDLLGITTLDIIDNTISIIQDELYEIEEDGIKKIVPKQYLLDNGIEV